VAPRQVASVTAIPGEETATENADAGWREHGFGSKRRTLNVERPTLNSEED
jgi:hypothetical protein